ncbi:MAG: RpiB/LacA/LacB family sugar-phosphate isomerase [Phycisphaerales bacterium]|nr:RpiB/LacA/LacB family sugar-phosphate isomerase [Phycisphaerales bacterium]MCB9863193.1 RpiB/LacA/LacB family sugar-phosphate isomerase [Phycisphaerales bacterium]
MRVGIATDHGGFELKERLVALLRSAGHDVVDFGAMQLVPRDDYPDFVIPLARDVASRRVERGIAVCGSGVGACIAANKVSGARACLIQDAYSARQGVEDDDMNIICFGARVQDAQACWALTELFLGARFSGEKRHVRRLSKVKAQEASQ